MENKFDRKIKRLRSDREDEYDSTKHGKYIEDRSIIHEVTPPYSINTV